MDANVEAGEERCEADNCCCNVQFPGKMRAQSPVLSGSLSPGFSQFRAAIAALKLAHRELHGPGGLPKPQQSCYPELQGIPTNSGIQ